MKKFLFLSVFILGCGASFNDEIQKIAVKHSDLSENSMDLLVSVDCITEEL